MHFRDLHKMGRSLLRSYFTLKITTADIIALYLRKFEAINTELSTHNGRSPLNTIKFERDKADFTSLPQTLTIYRGYREEDKRDGISWSLSRRVAEVFSHDATVIGITTGDNTQRNIRIGELNGREFFGNAYSVEDYERLPSLLVAGECDLLDVLAYTNIRREQEIIINPRNIRNVVDLKPGERHIVIPTDDYEATAEPLDWLLSTRQHHNQKMAT